MRLGDLMYDATLWFGSMMAQAALGDTEALETAYRYAVRTSRLSDAARLLKRMDTTQQITWAEQLKVFAQKAGDWPVFAVAISALPRERIAGARTLIMANQAPIAGRLLGVHLKASDVAKMTTLLDSANRSRRTRTLDLSAVLDAIFSARRTKSFAFVHGGDVSRSYKYRAYTTLVAAVYAPSEYAPPVPKAIGVGIAEGDAKRPSMNTISPALGYPNLSGWKERAERWARFGAPVFLRVRRSIL